MKLSLANNDVNIDITTRGTTEDVKHDRMGILSHLDYLLPTILSTKPQQTTYQYTLSDKRPVY